jgi:hypothetical protein
MENLADTLQYYCNLGHNLEGAFLVLIAMIAFIEAFKPKHPIVQRKYWPWASILAGILIPSFIYFHARTNCGLPVQHSMLQVPEIYHHYLIGLLFLLPGISELKLKQKNGKNKYSKTTRHEKPCTPTKPGRKQSPKPSTPPRT